MAATTATIHRQRCATISQNRGAIQAEEKSDWSVIKEKIA